MADFNQGVQGALGGAMAGGTFGGPIGAIGGGLLGGLAGAFGGGGGPQRQDFMLPGFAERQASLQQAIGQAGQVQAPGAEAARVGNLAQAGLGGQFRQGQLGLIGQLQAQAAGQGPSLAGEQLRQGLQQGISAQRAQAASGTGNQALAARQAAQNIGGLTQGMAGQAAQARIQEQLGARQQLAGVLGQARGQELAGRQFDVGQLNQAAILNAQMQQQAALANQDAILRNQQLQNQLGLGLRGLELEGARAQQAGLSGFAGTQQPSQLGTQLLSGGGGLLAQGFASGRFS